MGEEKKAVVSVLIEPMGCGKTAIGRMLSDQPGRPFYAADEFHPAENVAKMRAGIALNDADRLPRPMRLHDEICVWLRGQACHRCEKALPWGRITRSVDYGDRWRDKRHRKLL